MSILEIYRAPMWAVQLIAWIRSQNVDWGSVPDWLAGIGAVSALFFAAWAARSAHVTNKLQGKQLARLEAHEREREDKEQSEQASQIAVWLETRPYREKIKLGQERLAVCYSNTSGLPAYNILITPHLTRADPARSYKMHVLPPTTAVAIDEDASKLLQEDIHAWAYANSPHREPNSDDDKQSVTLTEYAMARQLFRKHGVIIQFDDCQGLSWERDEKGRLTPLDEDRRTDHWLL